MTGIICHVFIIKNSLKLNLIALERNEMGTHMQTCACVQYAHSTMYTNNSTRYIKEITLFYICLVSI